MSYRPPKHGRDYDGTPFREALQSNQLRVNGMKTCPPFGREADAGGDPLRNSALFLDLL
jgi:hypothetical protein